MWKADGEHAKTMKVVITTKVNKPFESGYMIDTV